ncbi:MAG: DUF58 domain-containing protein [Planctomycetes bacterium]|nr:DUF58 domain-containing protein [Planctomycetota bacterium]
MSVVGSRFLDPRILAKLPNLELVAKRLVQGAFVGYHKSPDFGYSVEFVDHRDYAAGDDLRTVDWRVWARKDKYFVKRFEMESQLKATVILDTSRSMAFGEGPLTKLEYGSYLSACIAYLLIHQNDMAGLVTFDERVRQFVPPRGSRGHLRLILHALGQTQPGPATDVAAVCHHLAETIKTRGMVVLVSDLLDEPEAVLRSLQHFQHKKHDVIVFHTLDDAELELPYEELSNFRDLESGRRLAVDPAVFRAQYRGRMQGFCEEIRQGCLKTGIDYHLIRTSQPIESILNRFVAFRLRRSV